MTAEELKLRESEAWLAEHLFGWTDIELYRPPPEEEDRDGRRFHPPAFFRAMRDGFWREVPHYSTDPAAALEVLEKCAEKIKARDAVAICQLDGTEGWRVTNANMIDSKISAEALALPLAIAKFAKQLFSGGER